MSDEQIVISKLTGQKIKPKPNAESYREQIDTTLLKYAIDFVTTHIKVNRKGSVVVYYSQPVERPYKTTIYLEVSIRLGVLTVNVFRFGGFHAIELSQAATAILLDYMESK